MGLQEWQIEDTDLITNDELGAGHQDTSIAEDLPFDISSVDNATKTITVSSGNFSNVRPENGDVVVITNGGAAGVYTLGQQVSDAEITVEEPIPDATSGSLQIYHPPGATRVGLNTQNIDNVTGSDLQAVLEGLDDKVEYALNSPQNIGDVVYSADGSSWTTEEPMVSRQGWLTNDGGTLLIK